jgi:hypothetical protein
VLLRASTARSISGCESDRSLVRVVVSGRKCDDRDLLRHELWLNNDAPEAKNHRINTPPAQPGQSERSDPPSSVPAGGEHPPWGPPRGWPALHVARPVWLVATDRGVLTARRLVITFVPVLELHFRDTCNTVSPETLPDRLRAAGFHDIDDEVRDGRQRWRSVKA